ncbi:S-layer homology domain-containing protein [Paenibacillus methanolicus]|uniref:S-layer homology domain-containing protein n=1 Tax=Paenibacillus methanolicus TaxID=582686 RepID=UPI001652E59A|nr:S-layer homology domain-containing protein [Paenibacillus methanolicus]
MILNNRGQFDKLIDLTRTTIAYAAAGGSSINDIAGIDLYTKAMNHTAMTEEGMAGLVSAYLVSTLSRSYSPFARTSWYSDRLFDRIQKEQLANGSWPDEGSKEGGVQSTALALIALSPVQSEQETVPSSSVQRALDWLQAQQSNDGSFHGSTQAAAQVIIALSSLRIDAAQFARIGGESVLHHLLSRQLDGGGFSEKANGPLHMAATLQAYLALTAYKLYINGEGRLTDLSNPSVGSANIQIEGPQGTVAHGRIPSGSLALDGAISYLKNAGIAYETKTDSSGQQVLTSIAGIKDGHYGGKDSWRSAVYGRFGGWMFEENAAGPLYIEEGETLLLYYGNDKTELIGQIQEEWIYNGQTATGRPSAHTPFKLTVNMSNPTMGGLPASGITVIIDGKKKITDAKGVTAWNGLAPGVHVVTMIGYRNGTVPAAAKRLYYLTVSAPELSSYKDRAQVSEWATDGMSNALTFGLIQGGSTQSSILAPKKALTRAEFVTMLLRLVHGANDRSTAKSPFQDVPPGKWYGSAIIQAAELGLTDRPSGRFEPDRAITREEAAVMSAHAGTLPVFGSADRIAYADTAGLSQASLKAIQAVSEFEVMVGVEGKFYPKQTLTREQASTILARLHRYLYPEAYLE